MPAEQLSQRPDRRPREAVHLIASRRTYLQLLAAWLCYYGLQLALAVGQMSTAAVRWHAAILFTTLAVVWTVMTPVITGTLNHVRARAASLPVVVLTHLSLFLL